MHRFVILLLICFIASCVPKQPVVFRKISNIVLDLGSDGQPVLKGEAQLYNPNHLRMRLKEINVEVFVDGKKSAHSEQKYNQLIPGSADFSVPLEVRLSMENRGLLNTVFNLLGGRKYEIHYLGYIRIKVHGISVKVPVDYKDEIRLKI